MFFKKKLTAKSPEFEGKPIAKALMQRLEMFFSENEKFRKEMKIAAASSEATTPTAALEKVVSMLLGQRFHSLMLTHHDAYFDGVGKDPIPAAVALTVKQNMTLVLGSALLQASVNNLASFSPSKIFAIAGVARCLRLKTASNPSSTNC